ncbi:putative rrna processing protein [Diaporthe ampelina]|uniref:Ribosomal RNA-processing protein 42 n=1 Tax=Diaporthe ampelina TaxID=1214573 RepID=A0A0G2HTG1_9PEZI|nr:putative rrna processing protein [Diaporthe ampelina]
MASTQHVNLSPAELAYLHASLSLTPPLRPDGRSATQFRPLSAETGILPGTNGSARICFADGTEAIVGVKAEIGKTEARHGAGNTLLETDLIHAGGDDDDTDGEGRANIEGQSSWVEIAVEIPGARDDDASTIYLAEMLSEALLADGQFARRLYLNRRFHWKLYLDILLISPPLSYPLPLLSLTAHLALLATRLPRLVSEGDEDPLFDDDWDSSNYLYPHDKGASGARPPVTLLVMAVGDNIIFDPAKEELAVADCALAISVADAASPSGTGDKMDVDGSDKRSLRLLSIRTIDPPSRLTPPGVPRANDAAAGGTDGTAKQRPEQQIQETEPVDGVWKAPRGGSKWGVLSAMIARSLEQGGVAAEVLDGLKAVELG